MKKDFVNVETLTTRLYYVEVELYSFILFGTGMGIELPETGASGAEAGESVMASSPETMPNEMEE